MERKVILANWKMNFLKKAAEQFVTELNKGNLYHELVIAPPYQLIDVVKSSLKNTEIKLAAQNCSEFEDFGPFTGEVSPLMLRDLGCDYALIGHSERRYLGETNELIEKKIKSALNQSLKVILCIGETAEEKANDQSYIILEEQILAIKDPLHINNIMIAYEPRWSIGTSISASIDDISKVFVYIENLFQQRFAKSPKILYGGSANEKNAKDILSVKHNSGLLIGSASLNVQNLLNICNIR